MEMAKGVIQFNYNLENGGFETQVGESHTKTVKFLNAHTKQTGFEGLKLLEYLKNTHYYKYVGHGIYTFTVHEVVG